MTIEFLDSPNLRTTSRWTATTSVTLSTAQARSGTYSYLLGTSGTLNKTIPTRTDHYFRAALYIPASNGSYNFIQAREGATTHIVLEFAVSGVINVRFGGTNGTIIGTSAAGSYPRDAWFACEGYIKVANAGGDVQVKINGVSVALNLTTDDTQNGGTANWNAFVVSVSTSGQTMYVDDICIRDDTWPGQHGVYVKPVSGAGDNAGWTASAGTPTACVSDIPPDYTDYIYADASVAGTLHDFATTALAVTPVSLGAVGVVAMAKLDSAGSGKVRSYGKLSTNYTQGSDVALDTTGGWADCYMTAKPGGGAWTVTDVDNLKVGVETRT